MKVNIPHTTFSAFSVVPETKIKSFNQCIKRNARKEYVPLQISNVGKGRLWIL